jgi:alpha-L-fucosidase
MLVDIVSKNGNLMLNIPVRGNGTIDDDELKVVQDLGTWMDANGEGIFATRPWSTYGEGPSTVTQARGQFGGARDVRGYTSEDVRFTQKEKDGVVFAYVMGWPKDGKATIKSLAKGGGFAKDIGKIELFGSGQVQFTRDATALVVTLPNQKPNDFGAYGLKITPA